MYDILNQPIQIGKLTIKNRIVMAPMVVFHKKNDDGFVTPEYVRHYLTRAEAGVGLIICEATCIAPEGRLLPYQLGLWTDEQIPGFGHIADACHVNGAAMVIQIHHSGRTVHPSVSSAPVGPVSEIHKDRQISALSEEGIETLIDGFAQAARRAAEAGADGVELHGCHGYMINQFTDPGTNTREDKWGGSFENRMRFPRRIVEAIRKATPEDFLVTVRMPGGDPDTAEGCALADAYMDMGIQALNVSFGICSPPAPPDDFPGIGQAWLGASIAAHVQHRLPVIAVGQLDDYTVAEAMVKDWDLDMVCIARGFLMDPGWARAITGSVKISE